MMNNEKIFFSPGASVAVAGLHLYVFLSPNLKFYACRSNMLNVTLSHRTNIVLFVYINRSMFSKWSTFTLRVGNGSRISYQAISCVFSIEDWSVVLLPTDSSLNSRSIHSEQKELERMIEVASQP